MGAKGSPATQPEHVEPLPEDGKSASMAWYHTPAANYPNTVLSRLICNTAATAVVRGWANEGHTVEYLSDAYLRTVQSMPRRDGGN